MQWVEEDDATRMLECLENPGFDESQVLGRHTLLEHAVRLGSLRVAQILLECNARGICLRQLATGNSRMTMLLNQYVM